jgi:transcriptional regulator with XRE-family HTH domain
MTKPKAKNLAKFGKRVAELRAERHLTQEQLAEAAGVSYRTIVSVEVGIRWCTLDTLEKIAKALKVPPMELLRNQ